MMELQLSDIIDFLPDATFAIDRQKRVIIWNKAIEKMSGIPAAEMIGKGNYAYTIPFYGEARQQLMDLVFEDQEEIAARYPQITRKGNTLKAEVFCPALYNNKGAWVFAKASPLHDQCGNVIGAIESIRDISESKRAEEELRYSLSLVNATLESTADGILVVDLDRRITRWNQKFIDLWQIPEKLLNTKVKTPVLNHIASQVLNYDEFMSSTMELYENLELSSVDTLNLIDGRVIKRFSQPQKIGNDVVGRVWSFEDITEQEIARETLEQNEARQRAMIENIIDVISVIDRDGICRYKSPNIEKLFGWRQEELLGKPLWDVFYPDDVKRLEKLFFSLLDNQSSVITLECRHLCKDGGYKWIEFTAVNLLHNPDIMGVLMSYHDISERKQAVKERKLLEHQFYQAQKMESLGVLAGGVAHDFNNILTIILGHCYMAREEMLFGEEYKTAFGYVESAGNRAADLCRQMLTYAGKSPLVRTKVNLWLLVDDVINMLESAIKKNVIIERDLQRDIPEIKGDSGQLQQIIMNLVINAAEAVGEANGTIRIVLSKMFIQGEQSATDTFGTVIRAGHYVCLEVSDNGTGMDEETQKRIFEPFFTTKFTGRGLGMSAIQGIVKAHAGILQLRSSIGVGTVFKVCFPVPEKKGRFEKTIVQRI